MTAYTSAQRGALLAFRNGLSVIALVPESKRPAEKDWQKKAFRKKNALKAYFKNRPGANFGIVTGGGLVALDRDGKIGKLALKKLERKYGTLPKTVTVITPGGGRHYYYSYDRRDIGNTVGELGPHIDVRGTGGLVVCAGSVHPNGGVYRYAEGKALGEIEIAPLPTWIRKKLKKPKAASAGLEPNTITVPEAIRKRAARYIQAALHKECERLQKAPDHQRNHTLNICAFKLGQLMAYGTLTRSGVQSKLTAVALNIGLDASEIGPTITSGMEAGVRSPRRLPFKAAPDVPSPIGSEGKQAEITAELAVLGKTESDNALRFARRCGDKVMHSAGQGWFAFDGRRWCQDHSRRRLQLAILTASKIAEEAAFIYAGAARSRRKFAQKSKSKSALTNMLDLAMPLLDVNDAKLDAAPDLLTVKNGTLDLTTGRLEPHDPRDLITKMVDVSFDPKAVAPNFQAYMKMATGGNSDLLEFLHRAVGYSLTGHIDEQAFFFIHGPGKSGKTTLLNVLQDLLGELACHTPTETLMVRNFDNNIPADLARLKGMRLTTASEANHNKQLDEAKIKAMTGGDPITARHLHKEWFEFIPTFKLWMAANDFPRVRATDGAMWRRIKAIPFRNEIPEAERDKKLPAKLKTELPGILAWAVRGAVLWRKEGLGTCAAVERTVSEWRKGSDLASRFFAECCARADGATVGAKAMHERYVAWCKANGEKHESDAKLKGQLIELDLAHARIKAGSVWKNVRLVK